MILKFTVFGNYTYQYYLKLATCILLPFTWYCFNFLVVAVHSVHWLLLHSIRLKCALTSSILSFWMYSKAMIKPYPKSFKAKWHLSIYARNNRKNKRLPGLFIKPIQYGFWVPQRLWTYSDLVSHNLLKNQNPTTPKKIIPAIFYLFYSCSSINLRHV